MRVVASVVILVAIAVACGGATATDVLDAPPLDAGASGSTGSASGSTSGNATSSGASTSSSSSGLGSSGCDPCESSSSGQIVDGGDEGGIPPGTCDPSKADACGPTMYCKSEGCQNVGRCARKPSAEDVQLDPVCGCDHVTYWNFSVAAIRGVNVASNGECNGGIACTRNVHCNGDAKCNLEPANNLCPTTEAKGVCWQLPKTCDGTTGRKVRRCNNLQCTTLCGAIDDERPFIDATAATPCP